MEHAAMRRIVRRYLQGTLTLMELTQKTMAMHRIQQFQLGIDACNDVVDRTETVPTDGELAGLFVCCWWVTKTILAHVTGGDVAAADLVCMTTTDYGEGIRALERLVVQ